MPLTLLLLVGCAAGFEFEVWLELEAEELVAWLALEDEALVAWLVTLEDAAPVAGWAGLAGVTGSVGSSFVARNMSASSCIEPIAKSKAIISLPSL